MTRAALEPLLSIPQVARQLGRPRRTVLRAVLALHAEDRRTHGDISWLDVRAVGGRRVLRLNLSRLRAGHPGWFAKRVQDPTDTAELLENLLRRVMVLETAVASQRSRLRALESAA